MRIIQKTFNFIDRNDARTFEFVLYILKSAIISFSEILKE